MIIVGIPKQYKMKIIYVQHIYSNMRKFYGCEHCLFGCGKLDVSSPLHD